MNLKTTSFATAFIVPVATLLACVVVSLKDINLKSFHSSEVMRSSYVSTPVPMVRSGLYAIWITVPSYTFIPRNLFLFRFNPSFSQNTILSESFVYIAPIVIRIVSWLKPHFRNRRMFFLREALIPSRLIASLVFLAAWMMAGCIFNICQPAYALPVLRSGSKYFATTAGTQEKKQQSFSFFHNNLIVSDNCYGTLCWNASKESSENCVNCWNLSSGDLYHNVSGDGRREGFKNESIEKISSQAPWKQEEGSTTRTWSLSQVGMAVKSQECATRKGRYSLNYVEICRSGEIKKSALTNLNSVPYTGLLNDLSAQPIESIINKVLKNDANKAMEIEAHAQFDDTLLTVTPAGGNSTSAITVETTGTPTATNAVALGNTHVKLIVDEMKERDIPAADGSNYMAIGRPTALRALKDDLESISQYVSEGFAQILNGEIGRSYDGVRFLEQTAIASEGWSGAQSDAVYFFGDDTVTEGMAHPEEIRGKIPTDFGRARGIAWYALGGFAITHNQAGAAQNRIIKWASAA